MRHKILLFCCLLGLSFLNPGFSQKNKSFFKRLFSPDSLRNFDESAWRTNALSEGLIGNEFNVALDHAKKQHIINNFYPNSYDIQGYKTGPGNNIFNAPCVNEGFESGNFTGWTSTIGTNTNSCAYPSAVTPLGVGPTLTVLTTPLVDPLTGVVIPNSPLGGSNVAKINDASTGGKVIKITQNFVVTNSNYLYDMAYYAVQNGIHNCCQQPYMFLRLRDCVGNLLACPNFTFNAPSGLCAGGGGSWINTGLGAPDFIYRSNGWQKYSVDLTQYIGTCVTVEVMVADCSPTGHYLYAYFDSNCNTMNLGVNGTPVSMPNQTVFVSAPCATTATLTAPGGLNPYNWNGPPLSGVVNNTNQTISSAVAGNYTLIMTPVGICNPITRVINLTFAPPASITINPPGGICIGGTATLTGSGAVNYTWNPGGVVNASIAVSPTATTIYTLTAQAGTCIGTFTQQVLVNPSPTVITAANNMSVCTGGPSTLTASGASTYTWSTGATGSATAVNPTVTTTYSVIGTTTAGCTGTANITINVVQTPTSFVVIASPTVICNGSTSNLFASAIGAASYTWFPGGLTGNFVVVSPTVTTVYTVVAANGSCTNSAMTTVSVSYGPTITPVASPTSICPGNSATLSATGAVSYTWNPMGTVASSVVVSPTVTTTYTVLSANALGCVSTNTITEVVSPVPSITITPASPSICIGTSGTLIASGAASYTWNPGGLAGATVVVSPTVNTTYTIIGSNGTCSSSTTSSLTVVLLPTVTASGSTPSICAGQSATLTGGGGTTYTWNPGALTGSNVAVSPTVTTTYTVTGSNGACSNTATVALTVNYGPTVTAAASPTAICAGSSSTLSASGGLSYTWNPGGLPGATVAVTPPSSTTYSVISDNAFGCTTTQTVSLTVNPNPTVTAVASSPSVCIGSSATITANGAASYTWNPGALTGSVVVVTPAVNTTYTINGLTGACPGSATISITVVPLPTVTAVSSPTAICNGASATLTANGATTYTWNPGALTGSNVVVNPSVNTTYTVIGNNGACSATSTVALIVNPTPTLTATASPTAVCVTGNVTLTATGAASYTWNPGALAGASVVVTPTITTTYTVLGATAFGCTANATVNVIVNTVPVLTLAATPATICSGASSTLTALGATAYTWNPGALTGSNVVVSPTVNTIYTVTASNGGCSTTGTLVLIVNPNPTVSATASPTNICAGGSSTLSGAGALTFTWNPGALPGSTVSVSPPATTVYTLSGSNIFGCTATATVNLVVTPNPTIIALASPTAICIGDNSTLTASGAASYTWNPGALTGSNVVVSPTATTNYTVTGVNGLCSSTQTVSVIVNPTPTLTAGASPSAICIGAVSNLTVTGGASYTWNPGALTGSNVAVTPTINTTYTVLGASAFGCTSTAVTSVTVNPLPTLSVSSTATNICAGTSATLTGSGGVSYTWNPGGASGSTLVITPTITTTYTLTGASALGCTNTVTYTQSVTPNPTITANATPTAICIGGTSTLTASGALSYTWNPGALTGSNVVVTPTATTVYTINGANGLCTGTQTLNLIVNPTPTLAAGASPSVICFGSPSTLTVSGGATYTWNPGALTGSNVVVTPTISTSYTVTGASAFGCTATAVAGVTVNPLPTLSVSSTATNICAGASATLTGSGGVSYIWNPGGIAGSTIAVSPSVTTVYTLTGTNGFGCLNTTTYTQVVTPNPTVTAIASPTAICTGGSATLTANGATTYTWNPGALTGSNVVVTPTINTTYTITGANGPCINTQTVSLIVNPLPTLTAGGSPNPVCNGSPVTLTVTGGVSYTWNPGALTGSNVVVTPTANTSYTATGANAFGCTNTVVTTVTVNPLPTLSITSTATNICAGATATLTASGGVSYVWSPGGIPGSTIAVSPTVTTIYTLSGTSGFGCLNTITFTLTVTPNPTVTASASPTIICFGGSSTLTANGAATYSWNPGALTGSNIVVSPTVNTTYTLVGANGLCTTTQTLSVTVSPVPTLVVNALPTAICAGGSSTLTVTGGTSYTWTPGALTGSNIVVTPSITTNYTVTGINGAGCTATAAINLTVNALPTLSVTGTGTNICPGASATLTASGAATYTWNPGALGGSTVAVTPTVTTVYTITGTSAAGCTSSAQYTLIVSPTPTVTAAASNTLLCSGASATLTANGATSYTWNPGALTGSNVVVTPGTSTVYTVTGTNGACTSSAVISITVTPTPTITASVTPTVICAGSTVTLSAAGGIVYAWLPIALNGATVTDSPTITTTYTVIGSNGSCTNSAMVTVSVNPVPSVSVAASPTSVCIGGSATLTAGGAPNYTWQPGGSNFGSIVVTPTITTTYSLFGANGACTNSTTITLSVNPLPTVTANASPTIVCGGSTVSLSAGGATTYSWNPIGLAGATVIANPTITTTYTVIGTDANGCSNQANVTVSVNAAPVVTAAATPTSICLGSTATLTGGGGAVTYTWNPGALSGTSVAVNPTVTTTYTLTGTDLIGCTGTQTIQLQVLPTPTVLASSSPTAICFGSSATLTANGALSYTWQPGNIVTATTVVSPTVTTVYTLTGSNGICGSGSATLTLVVNSLPANVTASVSGVISCANPSVNLFGSSTSTLVGYLWNGPGAYTAAVQNPTGIAVPGVYTVTVFNIAGGCSASATVAVITDSSVPTATIIATGTITCSNPSATLNAASSATNAGYNWSGPNSFTNTSQSCTISSGGTYTLTVTDLTNNCQASTVITVTSNTNVPITATIIPATCNGTLANNDARIITAGFIAGDKYDFVAGLTYTGAATYTTATAIPVGGVLTNTLNNPVTTKPYTVRFFGANGCIKDTTLFLTPTSCITNTVFGLAKAVSTPTLKPNGTYDVNYFVVVKNSGAQNLNNVILTENLSNTFPLPTTFSIVAAPLVTSLGTSLTIDATFDGSVQPVMTSTTSVLLAGKTDTIMFKLNVNPNGIFGPFKNSVIGFASPTVGVVFGDSTNTGYNTDPDLNGIPTDNNLPTVLNLNPNLFFGLTKMGEVSEKLADNTYDISYTITVHNLGNDTLKNIVVKDSLFNNTIKNPASYTLKSGPTASGSLTANAAYNGNGDINLVVAAQSKMPPGTVNSIVFTINVNPDTMTVIKNSAFGNAINSTGIAVSDTSGNGTNPDINDNGVWNEPIDNVPTILTISNSTLFVPNGFSPNGDGKNDLWVIKGLPVGLENTVTVYNRWGNKVYQKGNYDGTWNGFPNVSGTLGNQKLPQGTYYYIIEFKGGDMKALNGFVVLQY